MSNKHHSDYKSYYKELKQLRNSGCQLIYPSGSEVSPKYLAERMARDAGATYMRDIEYDGEGMPVSMTFTRVELSSPGTGRVRRSSRKPEK